jgi:hypothetical protein
MKFIVITLVCLPIFLTAQLQVNLPSHITIFINDTLFTPSLEWNDNLIDAARSSKIKYKIVAFRRDNQNVFTKLNIPQILNLDAVIQQVIIYYSLLNNEEDRENEEIMIYPYFSSLNTLAPIRCSYQRNGNFYFEVDSWTTIPIPSQPKPEEKELFNQIIELSFQQVHKFGDISQETFDNVAKKNKLSSEVVKNIYQNIILWQLSQ